MPMVPLREKMEAVALRQWKDSDFEPCAEMNADEGVMRYFLAPMSRADMLEMFTRMREMIDARGWGTGAVEVDGRFAWMAGLNIPRWQLPFSPRTEILWRLRKEYWGRGIAYEAATRILDHGFTKIGLDEIVAFTTRQNKRSIRLMARLGMTRDPAGDFDHPAVPEGHALRRHVLYRTKGPCQPAPPIPVCHPMDDKRAGPEVGCSHWGSDRRIQPGLPRTFFPSAGEPGAMIVRDPYTIPSALPSVHAGTSK